MIRLNTCELSYDHHPPECDQRGGFGGHSPPYLMAAKARMVHQMTSQSEFDAIARWLREARGAVVFTGAGISTAGGIPDFRSPNGVWANSTPVPFDEFLSSVAARREYWRQKAESHGPIAAAEPTAAHRALAAWERGGLLRGVITQNIDGLHQRAGSSNVLELHGTALEVACLECPARFPAEPFVESFRRTAAVPDCPACGGLLKHATISFGQSLSASVVEAAERWSRAADLFLVLGSSLVVYPAAAFPALAARHGARLAIVNREPTPLDPLAAAVIHAEIDPAIAGVDTCLGSVM